MKILSKGNPNKTKWYVGRKDTCYNCKSEVEFESDSDATDTSDYHGSYCIWACPVCNANNTAKRYLGHEIYQR